jgi:choline-sulfatase
MPVLRRAARGTLAAAALVATWILVVGCGGRGRPFDTIVLVTIDTLRADHLGCYGYPRPVSPFIDSLAAGGVRFERVVSSSSHTGPAHASLFTSQYPARHGVLVNGATLQAGIPSLASVLSEGGFETAAFVSVGFLRSVTHGFDFVDSSTPGHKRYRRAALTVDAALRWLSRRETTRRQFVWIHLYDVHQTQRDHRVPQPGLEARMQEAGHRRAEILRPLWMEQLGVKAPELARLLWRIDRYDAQLAYVDAELQRLVETASAGGRRTLWIVAADHGEGLGDHHYTGHGRYLYQAQLRVPLIFFGGDRWHAGAVVQGMVRHVDVLPTVLELAGVEPPPGAGFEGRSLVGRLARPSAAADAAYAFSQRRPPDQMRLDNGWQPGLLLAAQGERYKYILSSDGQDEFYDLRADPRELNNLVGEDLEAKDELRRWLARKYQGLLGDPLAPAGQIEGEYVEELKALGYL